jgi:RNA polymerase sigma factor (sigma-70 family)
MTPEEQLVTRAQGGDRAALEQLIQKSKDLVFNLAVRMLGSPVDAEDATQEILIRLVTSLSTFRGESSFKTWAYRVASNHLLTTRKRAAEQRTESLEQVGEYLRDGLADGDAPVEDQLLLGEAKLVCSSTMLLGLDREHRLAFILGEVLDLSAEEGAAVSATTPETFRKRLSRARERMAALTSGLCGLVSEKNACRCGVQLAHGIKVGRLDPKQPLAFSSQKRQPSQPDPRQNLAVIDGLQNALVTFRSHPAYAAPEAVTAGLRKLIDATPLGSR